MSFWPAAPRARFRERAMAQIARPAHRGPDEDRNSHDFALRAIILSTLFQYPAPALYIIRACDPAVTCTAGLMYISRPCPAQPRVLESRPPTPARRADSPHVTLVSCACARSHDNESDDSSCSDEDSTIFGLRLVWSSCGRSVPVDAARGGLHDEFCHSYSPGLGSELPVGVRLGCPGSATARRPRCARRASGVGSALGTSVPLGGERAPDSGD